MSIDQKRQIDPSRRRQYVGRIFAAALMAATCAVAVAVPAPAMQAQAAPPSALRLERVVMLVRHGVRAPLDGEPTSLAREAWPVWPSPGGFLTPHGAEGMRLLGAYDRQRFASMHLLPSQGCPAPGAVRIWTNAVERTIASGEALARGLAPDCAIKVDHLPIGQDDPLFAWPGAGLPHFDAAAAVAAVSAQTGGPAKLIAPYGETVRALETVLGCDQPGPTPTCDLAAAPGAITVSADGRGLDLTGPIRTTSGAAQVLMLEYVEGLPMDQVGWGRADPARLAQLSRLHALLFEVYSRPDYIAPRVAGVLGHRLLAAVEGQDGPEPAPRLSLFVGHDDNIAAVTALLGVHFQIPGYGQDDPPLGDALLFEVLKDRRSGQRYVRVLMQAQTPQQLRDLTPLDLAHPPALLSLTPPGCIQPGTGLCRLADFSALMSRRLTPTP